MKKPGLNRKKYDFSVDYKTSGNSDIVEIHKYLIKNTILSKYPIRLLF